MTDEERIGYSEDPYILEVQQEAMGATLERFESQIGDVDEFTAETAINLGMQYMLRDMQFAEISLKLAKLKGDVKEIQKSEQSILGAQVVIDSAKRGKFLPARSFFTKLGKWQLEIAEALRLIGEQEGKDTEVDAAELNKTGSAYLRLAEALPPKGEPFSFDK